MKSNYTQAIKYFLLYANGKQENDTENLRIFLGGPLQLYQSVQRVLATTPKRANTVLMFGRGKRWRQLDIDPRKGPGINPYYNGNGF